MLLVLLALVVLAALYLCWRQAESYGICRDCVPKQEYQLTVVNPFVYPYSGSSDFGFLAREKNLGVIDPFPSPLPVIQPDVPLTHLRSPDHTLLASYDGGGFY
jgi:hypothetical protein